MKIVINGQTFTSTHKALCRLRQDHKLSIGDIGKRLKMKHKSGYSEYEYGKQPSLKQFCRFVEAITGGKVYVEINTVTAEESLNNVKNVIQLAVAIGNALGEKNE